MGSAGPHLQMRPAGSNKTWHVRKWKGDGNLLLHFPTSSLLHFFTPPLCRLPVKDPVMIVNSSSGEPEIEDDTINPAGSRPHNLRRQPLAPRARARQIFALLTGPPAPARSHGIPGWLLDGPAPAVFVKLGRCTL
jgi:hypothetical protein